MSRAILINRIVIVGSGASLYKNFYKLCLIEYFGESFEILEISGRSFLSGHSIHENDLVLVFADPQYDYIQYHLKILKSAHNVILISSCAVLCPWQVYTYVKRKEDLEFLYATYSCLIFRVGIPSINSLRKNISPSLPISIPILLIDAIEKFNEGNTRGVVNGYRFQNNYRWKTLGAAYGLLGTVIPRPLLRPIDLFLKILGFSGYGYSFFS